MKKYLVLGSILFLCACQQEMHIVELKQYDEVCLTAKMSYENKKAELLFDNKPLFFDKNLVKNYVGDNVETFVSGDEFSLFYDGETLDHVLIKPTYIVEVKKEADSFYIPLFNESAKEVLTSYVILDEEYNYKSIESIDDKTTLYASIKESDYVKQEFIIDSLYSYNPRVDNSVRINNIAYFKNYSGMSFSWANLILNTSEVLKNENEKYDEEFFKYNSLITLYFEEPSGSISHTIKHVYLKKDTLYVIDDYYRPEIGDCAMAYWTIFVEIEKLDTAYPVAVMRY